MEDQALNDNLSRIVRRQLMQSTLMKAPRMAKISEYETAYVGNVAPKLRSSFNIPNLVFSGMVDTLISDFDDPIELKFEEEDAADYNALKKINFAWKVESHKLTPNARWDMKCRWDKKNAVFSGRGIQKTYASSNPDYKSHFDIVNYKNFHCETKGGGNLEAHLFAGQEEIFRTREELEEGADDGYYSRKQLEKILQKS